MSLSTLKMAVATLAFAAVFAENGRPGAVGRGRRLLDGQDSPIKVSKEVGCLSSGPFTTTNFYPIWAPGLCQVQPDGDYEGGQWDGHTFDGSTTNSMMVLECSEDPDDELIVMKGYVDVDNCDGEPDRVTYIRPGKREVAQDVAGFEMCSNFVSTIWTFPQHVIEACAPAQPDGPQLSVTEIKGCQGNKAVVRPIIWAPGQCQRSPWDETKSITIECDPEKDLGVHMHTYRRLDCTEKYSDYTIVHNTKFGITTEKFQGGGSAIYNNNPHSSVVAVDGCRRFQWNQAIRDACRLPTAAPTAEPTPAPTPEPTEVCDGVEKLSRRRFHKQLCWQFEQGPAGVCEGAECRYNERRNKCQATRENRISCLDVSPEHCCKFAGCFVSGNGVCVGNFEGYGN